MAKRVCKSLTLAERIEVLKRLQDKVSQSSVALEFGVNQSQISRIQKNKEKLIELWQSNTSLDRKRRRGGKSEDVEEALLRWFFQARDRQIHVNGPLLMQKAEQLAQCLGVHGFKATSGWLGRWKARNAIQFKSNSRNLNNISQMEMFGSYMLAEPVSLHEEQSHVESSQIFLEPPDGNILTDDDYNNEDVAEDVENFPDNSFQIKIENPPSDGYESDINASFSKNTKIETTTSLFGDPLLGEVVDRIDDVCNILTLPGFDFSSYREKNPIEIFEMMMTEDIYEDLAQFSNGYSVLKTRIDPNITADEMKCFVGILLLSGYNSLPSPGLYWSESADIKNHLVDGAMRRDRFFTIMNTLHFCDMSHGQGDQEDNVSGLHPLVTSLKNNFSKHLVPTHHLNFGEFSVVHCNNYGCKSCMQNNSHSQFNYKVWCLNAENSYLVDFDFSEKKNVSSSTDVDPNAILEQMVSLLDFQGAIVRHNRHLPFDGCINNYRIKIQGKTSTWPMVTWLLDCAVHNSWIIYQSAGNKMSNLDFRRKIVTEYLTTYGIAKKSAGKSCRDAASFRFDNTGHLIRIIPNGKRKRCHGSFCTSVVSSYCVKCNVGLCDQCFFDYHTKA